MAKNKFRKRNILNETNNKGTSSLVKSIFLN